MSFNGTWNFSLGKFQVFIFRSWRNTSTKVFDFPPSNFPRVEVQNFRTPPFHLQHLAPFRIFSCFFCHFRCKHLKARQISPPAFLVSPRSFSLHPLASETENLCQQIILFNVFSYLARLPGPDAAMGCRWIYWITLRRSSASVTSSTSSVTNCSDRSRSQWEVRWTCPNSLGQSMRFKSNCVTVIESVTESKRGWRETAEGSTGSPSTSQPGTESSATSSSDRLTCRSLRWACPSESQSINHPSNHLTHSSIQQDPCWSDWFQRALLPQWRLLVGRPKG